MEKGVQLNKKYYAGPEADTDLHAGGIFFCIIYCRILTFLPNGVVKLTQEVWDSARRMDDYDAERITNRSQTGRFRLNDRGYIHCVFDTFELTGSPTEANPALLAFHGYNKTTHHQWGVVYTLEDAFFAQTQ